jgi:UDP-N-acetylmuramate--alanine ligase
LQPFAGRRIWLVGIGGAGLSAYGVLARAWGAEVGGWDRNETPYLEPVRAAGIEVVVSPEPELREGWEIVVSSASSAGRTASRRRAR